MQSWCWSALYVVFGVGVLISALSLRRLSALPSMHQEGVQEKTGVSPMPSAAARRVLWLCLPGCASVALLAITNMVSQDIAPVPLL